MSERWACRLVNQPRGTQRYRPTQREDEDRLTQAIIVLAKQYGRYGYRRITALLKHAGWQVGKDRVEKIWRREGLDAKLVRQRRDARTTLHSLHRHLSERQGVFADSLLCHSQFLFLLRVTKNSVSFPGGSPPVLAVPDSYLSDT
jgi:transposase InsO family protein